MKLRSIPSNLISYAGMEDHMKMLIWSLMQFLKDFRYFYYASLVVRLCDCVVPLVLILRTIIKTSKELITRNILLFNILISLQSECENL